ncbi:hypothetical protein EXU57_08155 [Segetibacter sp. 3557_3]|nr:hypothetical protein EXU57_08155 [Segetibacter sp. 3557_3]
MDKRDDATTLTHNSQFITHNCCRS